MENVFAEMVMSEEDRAEQRKIAQVKRSGQKYFQLVYVGRQPVAQLKIQGLKNIEAYKTTNENGEEMWASRPGADAYYFREDSTGKKMTDIWDDPDAYNRHWVSRHVGYRGAEFVIEDKELEGEILELSDKPYKVELSEKEALIKKKRDLDKRLEEIEKAEAQTVKHRGRQKKQSDAQPQYEEVVQGG
jgi:hypothetical protein